MPPRARTGYALGVAAAFVWAATSPGLSYLLTNYAIPPLTLAFWRDAMIALVCGAALLALRPGWLRISRRDLRGFATMGAISIGIYHAIFVSSVALNGAALAIVLIYTYPAFVTLGAWLIFKERIGAQQIVALVLAFAGCVLVVRAYDPALLRGSWFGTLVGLASAATHAGYVLFNQRAVTRHSPWVALTLTMFFGALTLLALTLLISGPASLGAVGPGLWPWLLMLGLALGPTLGGYALFTIALRHIPGRIASLIVVLEVPIATLLAVALLGERLVWPQVAGMLLVLLAAGLPGLRFTPARRTELSVES